MTYYLDANILVYIIRNVNRENLDARIKASRKYIKVPSIVKAKLITGAYKRNDTEDALIRIEKLLSPFEVVPFDDAASEVYGKVRADLEAKGKIIGANDMIIAATVLSRGGILVTNNVKEFERVEGLQIENWSK